MGKIIKFPKKTKSVEDQVYDELQDLLDNIVQEDKRRTVIQDQSDENDKKKH